MVSQTRGSPKEEGKERRRVGGVMGNVRIMGIEHLIPAQLRRCVLGHIQLGVDSGAVLPNAGAHGRDTLVCGAHEAAPGEETGGVLQTSVVGRDFAVL